jgi:hypothetical protein
MKSLKSPKVWYALAAIVTAYFLVGCSMFMKRAVFLPTADAPVRAGPNVRGQVYMWDGEQWELSGNNVLIPEGYYIWDSGEGHKNLPRTNRPSVFVK